MFAKKRANQPSTFYVTRTWKGFLVISIQNQQTHNCISVTILLNFNVYYVNLSDCILSHILCILVNVCIVRVLYYNNILSVYPCLAQKILKKDVLVRLINHFRKTKLWGAKVTQTECTEIRIRYLSNSINVL